MYCTRHSRMRRGAAWRQTFSGLASYDTDFLRGERYCIILKPRRPGRDQLYYSMNSSQARLLLHRYRGTQRAPGGAKPKTKPKLVLCLGLSCCKPQMSKSSLRLWLLHASIRMPILGSKSSNIVGYSVLDRYL